MGAEKSRQGGLNAAASPPLFCANPFSWCEIHGDGSVFLCCPAWLKGPAGNLFQSGLAAIWNGPRALAARRSILDGTFSRCNRHRCPRLATLEPPVLPRAAVADPALRAVLASGDPHLPRGPRRLNLCFDRSCNLACPSCRHGVHVARGEQLDRGEHLVRRIVREAGADAEELILSGTGDPFASPVYFPLLAGLDRQDFPRLRRIRLLTNGLLWDEAHWGKLAAVHPFVKSAEISVDAASSATYERNRGGDFERLLANLAFVATLPVSLILSCVVQANNFRELPAFVALARRFGARAYLSQLVNWGTFSGEEYRRRAVHRSEHAEHRELLAVLRPLAGCADVDLGNLRPLVAEDAG